MGDARKIIKIKGMYQYAVTVDPENRIKILLKRKDSSGIPSNLKKSNRSIKREPITSVFNTSNKRERNKKGAPMLFNFF